MRVSAIICALAASFLLLVQWSCAETSAARHAGKHHGPYRSWNADGDRIYVTGISNGGMMAYKLGCELSDQIAAIAPIEGCLHA